MDESWEVTIAVISGMFVVICFLFIIVPVAIQDFWLSRIWCRLTGGHAWPETKPDRGWNRCLRGCGAWEK